MLNVCRASCPSHIVLFQSVFTAHSHCVRHSVLWCSSSTTGLSTISHNTNTRRTGSRYATTAAAADAAIPVLQPFDKLSPAHHRLSRVQPHAGRHADQHRAHILEHKHLKIRSRFRSIGSPIRTRYREQSTHVAIPLHHPVVEVAVLVQHTAQKPDGRQHEQTAKETDTHHEALQFVCTLAVAFHHRANAKQRHKTGEQKQCTNAQVDAERQQQKDAKRMRVQVTDETDAGQDVT